MKTSLQTRMMKVMLIGAVAAIVAAPIFAAQPQGSAPLDVALRGSWTVTLTAEEGGPPPFKMLMLFTRDGGVVQTDAGPPTPLQFSPGLGEWTRESDGQYTIRYTQLQFDENQNLTGTFRAKIVATFDESKNLLVGNVQVRFYDLSEAIVLEGDGKVEGTRLPQE